MMRRLREPDNGLTHLAGAFLAVIALIILTDLALHVGSPRHIVAFAIFGVSLVGLYTASGLYHSLHLGPVGLDRLLRLDCVMVYVLIAGTYTPFCLVAFQGVWRWGLLALIWALAIGGSVLKLRMMDAPIWLSTGIYVAMGWAALLAIPAFVATVPLPAILWVLAGGIVYTVGAVIFALERPRLRPGVFGPHALWHVLVIAGSACHVWAVARYLTTLT
jgi:hemolysin III